MQVIIDLYNYLSNVNEPLGAEFQEILNDNLWDLYEE